MTTQEFFTLANCADNDFLKFSVLTHIFFTHHLRCLNKNICCLWINVGEIKQRNAADNTGNEKMILYV